MNLNRYSWLGWVFPSAVLVLLLWLPFGFTLHGLIEEWGVLGLFTSSGPVLFVTPDSVFEAHRLRPLTVFPHALSYLLDPDSFNAWHSLMIGALVLKGAASSYLGAWITRSPRWGVCFGMLVLLYPADTMQLSFRGLHINAALALMLLGAALLVHAQDRRPGASRYLVLALGAASLVAAQMMYEVAFTLAALPLVALWCRGGLGAAWRDLRTRPAPTLGWVLAALLYAAYVIWASSSGSQSYQQTLTSGRSPLIILWEAIPQLFKVGMARALVGGWFDAWGMATTEFNGHVYLLAFGLICAAITLLWPSAEAPAKGASSTRYRAPDPALLFRMVLAGLALFALGYGPYLLSGAHLLISQRTFLFASPGAALVVLALLMGLTRLWKPLGAGAVLCAMTLGAAAQLYQFHHYVELSEAQRKILRTIVENFDGDTHGKSLLILDRSDNLSHTWFLRDNLHLALTYLYAKPIPVPEICLMPSAERQRPDALARPGRCIEEEERWIFKDAESLPGVDVPHKPDHVVPKSAALTLVIEANGTIKPDPALDPYRAQLATAETPAGRRYRHILAPSAKGLDLDLFGPVDRTSYRWDFGRWWSLEVPVHGSGWREAEWKLGWLHHDAAAWKTREDSSLLFELSPLEAPYVLHGRFSFIVNPSIKDSIRLRLNGTDVAFDWEPDQAFTADIPSALLKNGLNTLEVNSNIDRSYYGLSAQLSSFQVRPAP